MTKEMPNDHEEHAEQNRARRLRAARIVEAYRREVGGDAEDALADLLCDLMHGADVSEYDFDVELEKARAHYRVESTGVEA